MRIAVSGKGGTGKTTLTGALVRMLVRGGHRVLALDADTNPNLAGSLGVPREVADSFPTLIENPSAVSQFRDHPGRFLEQFGCPTSTGALLMIMGRVSHADAGCMCRGYTAVRDLLAGLDHRRGFVTVADMNAGLEYFHRGSVRYIDTLLIVTEPYSRSLETAVRVHRQSRALNIKNVYGIANKVRDERDRQLVEEFFQQHQLKLLAAFPYFPEMEKPGEEHPALEEFAGEVLTAVVRQIESDYRHKLLCDMMFSLSERFLLHGDTDLTRRELLTIRHLGLRGPLSMGQLAELLKAAFSTTTAIVDKLSARNYVERSPHLADQRVIFVKLTEAGENLFRDQTAAYEKLVKKLTERLDADQQQQLVELLRSILFSAE